MDARRSRLDELKVRLGGGARVRRAAIRGVPRARSLAEVVGGCELVGEGGKCWLLETPFERACPEHTVRGEDLGGMIECAAWGAAVTAVDPRRTIVLDIETGGFAGMPVFLIGIARLDGEPLRVVQLQARDYPEEAAILAGLAGLIADGDTWVTFNGKSFDEPFLRDRARLHGIRLPEPGRHVDLLHAARRVWRHLVPNCKLTTLEAHLLGRRRVGDAPSGDVPELFRHFIQTGNAGPLAPVLLHNQIDVISCVELLLRLGREVTD